MKNINANTPQKTLEPRKLYRDRIDMLRSRVNLLSGTDKLLMTMYLNNANSFRQMGRLTGVNEGNIARRIHRIMRRLIDGEYITCLQNRDRFTKTELAVAKDYFLLALSQKKIAERRRHSLYQIRKILKKIQELVATQ